MYKIAILIDTSMKLSWWYICSDKYKLACSLHMYKNITACRRAAKKIAHSLGALVVEGRR